MKSINKLGVLSLLALIALITVFAGSGATGQPAEAQDEAALFESAVKLADEEKYEESNKIFMQIAKKSPNHPDVYWKISMNFYDIGERIDIEKDKDGKMDMYLKAEEWGQKGYDKNPGLADNTFWTAVGLSQQAQTRGIASTLLSDRTLAKRIEDMYTLAINAKEFHYVEKNSNTIASAHFALGQFYRKIPDSFFVGLLMGTRGDMDKAVEHAAKAVEMFPNNVEFTKEAGVARLCRGMREDDDKDIAEAEKYLNKVLTLEPETVIDEIDHADAKRLLGDHSLACGYSRVQQEEVSDDAFKDK